MQKIVSLLLLSFLTFSLEAAENTTFLADNSLTTVPACRYSTQLNDPYSLCRLNGTISVMNCSGSAFVNLGFCVGITSISDFSQFEYCSMGWCSAHFFATLNYALLGFTFTDGVDETRWFHTDPDCCLTGI